MIKINLIPVKERKKIKGLNELTLGLIAILAVFILLVALQLWRIKEIRDVNNKIADTKARILKIEGVAWDELTVSDFMKRLQSFPYFQNVELKVINTKEIQKLPLKAFVIESKLNYSGKVKTEEKPQEKPQEKPDIKKPSQQKAQR